MGNPAKRCRAGSTIRKWGCPYSRICFSRSECIVLYLPEPLSSGLWLDADTVVDSGCDPLDAAQVPLRRLYRDVSEEKLYLFQFAARRAAEPCAS
jgi:hypothetical protein